MARAVVFQLNRVLIRPHYLKVFSIKHLYKWLELCSLFYVWEAVNVKAFGHFPHRLLDFFFVSLLKVVDVAYLARLSNTFSMVESFPPVVDDGFF